MSKAGAVVVLLLLAGPASAQQPVTPLGCVQRLDCQQQRVMDLKDYREYLEGELALCKSLLNDARQKAVLPTKPPATAIPVVPPPRGKTK